MTDSKNNILLACCSGCEIGKSVDVDRLISLTAEERPEVHCMKHGSLCSEAGMQELHRELSSAETDKVVIAACSPRNRAEQFDLEGKLVERVNLREQVAWVMEAGNEDTQMCAEDQLRMALARMESITEPEPYVPAEPASAVLVVGGGNAGLHAALAGAEAGYRVHLVEKTGRLGGYAGRIHKLLPRLAENGSRSGNAPQPGNSPLREPDMETLVGRITSHEHIEVYLESGISAISGEPGDFRVKLEDPSGADPADADPAKTGGEELKVGSVVLATGWKPYAPEKLAPLGYGTEGVYSLEEFEESMSGGKVPGRVLFILCAGSRDEEHLAYCSAYCCTAALKQALYVREKNPDALVYIVYRDIRTTGFQEEFYKQVQADEGIFMTRGKVDSVSRETVDSVSGETGNPVPDSDGPLRIVVKDSLLDDEVILESDAVVLASGMVPNATEDLHLQYRLGEGIPSVEYDFSDSHFICFPYETRRTGIYAAGCVRAPMDLDSATEDGQGAMMKAIQCIECVKRGEAVHPRAGDMSYPELYMERCTDCKRCTEECPFGAYDETEKGTPLPNPSRCRRCGICLGSCPERVIGFADYNINSVSAMIKAVHVPDEFEEKPRILAFVCENDAYPALDAAGIKRLKISPYVRIIPVRCLGSVNKVWVSDALSHGYDGILQIGCKPGDDYQCHFIHGSELTEQRGENLQETLQTMMLEPERIMTHFVEINEHHKIAEIINDYAEELELIGPNPFKSM